MRSSEETRLRAELALQVADIITDLRSAFDLQFERVYRAAAKEGDIDRIFLVHLDWDFQDGIRVVMAAGRSEIVRPDPASPN